MHSWPLKSERRKDMNKADLINEVAKVVKTKKDAQMAVDAVLKFRNQILLSNL
jgi:nucleoid DNA-binding protein